MNSQTPLYTKDLPETDNIMLLNYPQVSTSLSC
jgi:hypothetical protein